MSVILPCLFFWQNSDCIYVLGNGEVLEYGTHEELLAKEDGAYYNLNKAQITNRKINWNCMYSSSRVFTFPSFALTIWSQLSHLDFR